VTAGTRSWLSGGSRSERSQLGCGGLFGVERRRTQTHLRTSASACRNISHRAATTSAASRHFSRTRVTPRGRDRGLGGQADLHGSSKTTPYGDVQQATALPRSRLRIARELLRLGQGRAGVPLRGVHRWHVSCDRCSRSLRRARPAESSHEEARTYRVTYDCDAFRVHCCARRLLVWL
jgi:hypothetical protein